jgi:hypothetical protein
MNKNARATQLKTGKPRKFDEKTNSPLAAGRGWLQPMATSHNGIAVLTVS